MTSRRQFLQIGIAATTWPMASRAARAAAAAATGDPSPLALHRVVYDERIPASVAFAKRVRSQSLPAHGITGDITNFWYHELDPLWRREPITVAGLTAHGPLFCLERLAWERGMRVVLRAEHVAERGRVRHTLSGPSALLDAACRSFATEDWPARVADLLARCPSGRTEITTATCTTVHLEQAQAAAEPLYSWLIAPAVRA